MGLNTWCILQAVKRRDIQGSDSFIAGLFICARSGCGDPRTGVSLKPITGRKPSQSLYFQIPFKCCAVPHSYMQVTLIMFLLFKMETCKGSKAER